MDYSRTWLVRCGEGGFAVDSCISSDLVAVRYAAVGDVRERTDAQILEELETTPGKSKFETLRQELLMFAKKIAAGDIIVTSDKDRRRFYIGVVTGPYEWLEKAPKPDMRHVHTVDWRNFIAWDDAAEPFGKVKNTRKTVVELKDVTVKEACAAAAAEKLPVDKLLTRVVRSSKSSLAKIQFDHAALERTCTECGLKKNPAQFSGASSECVDCA